MRNDGARQSRCHHRNSPAYSATDAVGFRKAPMRRSAPDGVTPQIESRAMNLFTDRARGFSNVQEIGTMSSFYKAEYIWIDGTKPTALLRSKTRVLPSGMAPGVWGFDGSSTGQAPGHASDCVLRPVFVVHDPVSGSDNKLVLSEVLLTDMRPHPTNTRAPCEQVAKRFAAEEMWFGIEQEYTLFKEGRPLGWPKLGNPGPQGPYYCSIGSNRAFGREIVDEHLDACLSAGIRISGTNGEVMPGQWEYQVGPLGPVEVADQLWVARWLMDRIAAKHGVEVRLDAKPVEGDWNGAGAHTNFSSRRMRESYEDCLRAAEALGKQAALHIANYGDGIERRLTGKHETCAYSEFRFGVSDRGASVRIPWQVALEKRGYIEDRRPNANCDPYVVTRLITETVSMAALNDARRPAKSASAVGAGIGTPA
jgi:glutamine synthetase